MGLGCPIKSRSVIKSYNRLGGLNIYFPPTVLEAEKSIMKVPTDLESVKDPIPGFWLALFLWCPHDEEGDHLSRLPST